MVSKMSIKISKNGVLRLALTTALAFSPLMMSETVLAQAVDKNTIRSMSWEELSKMFPKINMSSIQSRINDRFDKKMEKQERIGYLYRTGVSMINNRPGDHMDSITLNHKHAKELNESGKILVLAAAILEGKAGSKFVYGGKTWTYSADEGIKLFEQALPSININENTSWDELLKMGPKADNLTKKSKESLQKALAMNISQKKEEGSSLINTGLHDYAEAMIHPNERAKKMRAKRAIELILVGKALLGHAPDNFLEMHNLEFSNGELKKK